MFKGYLSLGGTEIINAARTQAYVDSLIPRFPLKTDIDTGTLREAIGDDPYTNPLADNAPWANANNPYSWGFYGLFPQGISGSDNSSFSNDVTESILNGGFVGRSRYGTKQLRVTAIAVAKNELALQAGLDWLNAALAPGGCANGDCGAQQACWYVSTPGRLVGECDPEVGVPDDETYERHYNDVTLLGGGVQKNSELVRKGLGGVSYEIEFGLTLANPFAFTTPKLIGSINITMGVTASQIVWDQGRLIATNIFIDPASTSLGNFVGFVSGGANTLEAGYNGSNTVNWPHFGDVHPPGGGGGTSLLAASCLRLVATTAGTYAQVLSVGGLARVTPGVTYYGQVYAGDTVAASGATGGIMQWFAADGTTVIATSSLAGQTMGKINPTFPPGSVNQILCSGVAPAGAVYAGMGVRFTGTVPVNYQMYVNGWQIETGTWTDWFYGNSESVYWSDLGGVNVDNDFYWTGGSNNSPSQRFANWLCGVDSRTKPLGVTTPAPPRPPNISSSVVTTKNWNRYFITIPANEVSEWSSMVPTITVTAPGGASTPYAVRMRVMENPFNRAPSALDYCDFCGEWMISVMPSLTTITIDGENQRSVASVQAGPEISADTLIYGTNGAPMQWPELSCGMPYVLAIDTPRTSSLVNTLLSVSIELSRKS